MPPLNFNQFMQELASPGTISGTVTGAKVPYRDTRDFSQIAGGMPLGAGLQFGSVLGASTTDQLNSEFQRDLQRLLALQRSQQAVKPDFGAIQARARTAAEKAVNPFYVKQLNDFLSQQALKRRRTEEDVTRTKQELDIGFQNLLKQGQIQRERTGEDVTRQLGEIGTQEDIFQTEEGRQFEQVRQALQQGVAQAGLTTSGLGRQQIAEADRQRNVTSAEQTRSFNVQRQAQQQFKTRTFEDLLRGEKLAEEGVGRQKAQIKIDLDRFIEDLATEETTTRQKLEVQRLQQLQGEEANQRQLQFRNFIAAISNPEAAARTAQIYGGLV